jgi:nucleotide-binding universal stress UspA family protein
MKNILVPTDFSHAANKAADIAMAIAEKSGAEVHFLHLQITPVQWVKLDMEKEERFPETQIEISHAKSELNKLVKKAEDRGLKAEQFLVFDVGREEILKHTHFHRHDFIVMGSHGASGAKEIFVGSNAQKVLRDATIPVLIIKEKSKWPFNNIVFASSFEEDVKEPFQTVVKLANLNESSINLLYVNVPFSFEETDISLKKIHAFHETCPRGGTCTTNIYNALNEERGILKFSKSVGADLIALVTHGKSGFLSFMRKSITENLANHSETPILSINLNK